MKMTEIGNIRKVIGTGILLATAFSPLAGLSSEGDDPSEGRAVVPRTLGLEAAKALAQVHNPVLKQLREGLNEQEGSLRETQAARRPQLDLRSGYTVFDQSRQQSFGASMAPEETRWDGEAEASIPVFAGGRNRRAVLREMSRKDAVEADLDAVLQTLLTEVYEAYYDAQLARESVKVQEKSIDLFKEQLKYAQNRLDAGVGARFDVMQAEVSLANARPPLIRAKNNYRRNIDTLRRVLGLVFEPGMDAEDVELDEVKRPEEINFDLEQALQEAAKQRPELREAALLLEAAHQDVQVTRRERSPVVDLFANYGAESDQFGDDDLLHGWTAGVRLDWPFWDGGETKGRVMQKEAQLRALMHEEEELHLAIASEVRQAFYDYQEARSILETTGLVIGQAEEALRLARNRYQAGRGTQLDVLESQLQLTRARLEDSVALNSLQRALIRIKRAMGAPL